MKTIPASDYERFFWNLSKKDPQNKSLLLEYEFLIEGTLDVDKLKHSLEFYLDNYHSDAKCFFVEDEKKLLKKLRTGIFNFSFEDLSINKPKDNQKVSASVKVSPGSNLYHFKITKHSDSHYVFYICFSHIIFDGYSYKNFVKNIQLLYNTNPDTWKKYVATSNQPVTEYTEKDKVFWESYIGSNNLQQELNFLDNTQEKFSDLSWISKNIAFSKKETLELFKFIDGQNITLFQFLTACMGCLIYKYNSYEDVTKIKFCYTVNIDHTKNSQGCYTNINPLLFDINAENSLIEIAQVIKDKREKIKPYQALPFQKIIENIKSENPSHKFGNVIINHSPALIGISVPKLTKLKVKINKSPNTVGFHELALTYNKLDEKLHIQVDLISYKSSKIQLDEIFKNFKNIAGIFVKQPKTKLSEIKLLTDFDSYDGKKKRMPTNLSLSKLFNEAFTSYSSRVALECDGKLWTYQTLLREVEEIMLLINPIISRVIKEKNQIRFGVHLNRSQKLLFSLLALIMQNRCFVPLDPTLPQERLSYYIKASKLDFILSDTETLSKSKLSSDIPDKKIINIDITLPNNPKNYLDLKQNHNQHNTKYLQYILFTSGSTGTPKGVMISHKNLLNFIISMQEVIPITKKDKLLALTSINFDISLLELLLPLVVGAKVEIAENAVLKDATKLGRKINDGGVTIVQATPSTWKMLQKIGWDSSRSNLKILSGGEKIEQDLASYLLKQSNVVINLYGPTECTIWASYSLINDLNKISIGIPIHNTRLLVLDRLGNSVPLGVTGELCIVGESVGLGYINADSQEVFQKLSKDKYLYKTGDLVKNFGQNYIRYICRHDKQVKMRGYRIELNEVSGAIKKSIECIEAITSLVNYPEPHLVSFIQKKYQIYESQFIYDQLKKILPQYAIPSKYIFLDEFPLNSSMKIDEKKLLEQNNILSQQKVQLYAVDNNSNINGTNNGNSLQKTITALQELFFKNFNIVLSENEFNLPFGEFGLNSLSFNILSMEISKVFALDTKPHDFYRYNTLKKLVYFISQSEFNSDKERNVHQLPYKLQESISVIGIFGKMPLAEDFREFWNNLILNIDTIKNNFVDRSCYNDRYKGAFISSIEHFDNKFFHISPIESIYMDPQQRLLLQSTWKTLEDAGYNPNTLENDRVGVYVASTSNDYYNIMSRNLKYSSIPYSMSGLASSILANRISHFFNWNGPSYTIDTACSGSLVAIIRAYNDLYNGTIDYALVASTNIILDTKITEALSAGNFLSPNNRCATFDEGADGYVRGEGVGCVLLKRKSDAIRDKDQIYANIISCSENHGGRAHSLTAPNPEAQKALLIKAYKDKELAQRVSYIETHGTGTKLGDPIEVDALKMAWQELGAWNDNPYIGLGSVKTHIGHLEPAAGIASLLKVLLAMKHRTLPGNLHFNKLNPYIDIKNSPFYIVSENQEWKSHEPLLVAGISSFGFGGSNTHVVLEEAPKRARKENVLAKPFYLICISAKSLFSLLNLRKNLVLFLSSIKLDDFEYDISNIAYTLNAGREHFSYRNSWVVRSIDELIEYISKEPDDTKEVKLDPTNHKEIIEYDTNAEVYYSNLINLKEVYLSGRNIDWNKLHENEAKFRLSLPTYHFDTKPYWFENVPDSKLMKNKNFDINEKEEKNSKNRYEITILNKNRIKVYVDYSHPWFKDHIVNNNPMIPGVAHLSIALEGAKRLGLIKYFGGFEEINWVSPIRSNYIIVTYKHIKELIYFELQDLDDRKFSEGIIIPNDSLYNILNNQATYQSPYQNIKSYSKNELYDAFNKIDIKYGKFFKNLNSISILDTTNCSAVIEIDQSIEEIKTNLLDAAFQSTLGLSIDTLEGPLLPFSAGKIYIAPDYLNIQSGEFYVIIEKKSKLRVDIRIFDHNKKIILMVKDLGILPIRKEINDMLNSNTITDEELSKQTTFVPRWEKSVSEKLDDSHNKSYIILYTVGSKEDAHFILEELRNTYNVHLEPLDSTKIFEKIENIISKNIEIILVDSSKEGIGHININDIYDKTYYFIELLKKLSKFSGITIKVVSTGVVQFDEYNPDLHPENSLLVGIAQTAAKEFTNLTILPIAISQINQDNVKLLKFESNIDNPLHQPVLYFKGDRYVRKLVYYRVPYTKRSSFRNNGSYIIFGGLGGIGFELSKYLLKNYNANLILVGRSNADNDKLNKIKDLGGKVTYERVNLLDKQELSDLLAKFTVDGIIHSALTLEDKTLQFMSKETLYKVLDPKVKGAINLYTSIIENNLNPDFILFFSSIQSFIANSGQANYTAACVFKDTLAHLLRNYEIQNTKIINWGYWGSVGIVSSDEYRNRMKSLGIGSIEPHEAFEIIEYLITSDINQIIVIKGTNKALKNLHIYLDESTAETKNLNNEIKVSNNKYYESSSDRHLNTTLQTIVPDFFADKDTVQNHELAQQKLEQYARFSIQQISIPEKFILSRYNKLINAIKAMPKVNGITKEEILHKHPWLKGHIQLLDECISKYPDILIGKIDYMSVLFPNGKFDLVEPVYRDNPIADYYNIKVSEIVENYIQNQKEQNQPIKIIEIGAGTGSTTKFVLPKLRENDSYYYTDLSIAFLKKAEGEFNSFSNVSYGICNIEDAPKDHLNSSFDILIATNVLHANKDIDRTISNARQYLKNNGIAIINEVTERSDYATLTFGLTPGWWIYSDSRIVDSPLIDPKTWKKILNNNNFSEVRSHGNSGQQVIVGLAGEADSIISTTNQILKHTMQVQENYAPQNKQNNIETIVEEFIRQNVSQIMKIPYDALDSNTPFAHYGIDSLIVLELAKPFKEIYKELPNTIFFEYSTISKLRNYLVNEHPNDCKNAFEHNQFKLNLEQKKEGNDLKDNEFKSWLKNTICHVIRINPDELNEDSPFAHYGIDSLITLEIVKTISTKLGYIPNTIFFEYTTFSALLNYFTSEYKAEISNNFSNLDNNQNKVIFTTTTSVKENKNSYDIAVIGISGIFPRAKNIEEFWNNLSNGLNCTVEIPLERWDNSKFYDPDGGLGTIYTKYGCFIDGVEHFDHKFFQITPFDAENIDPQERLFMQTTYHAIENSGYKMSDLKGLNVGVFVGVMNAGYSWLGIDTEKMNWADSLYWSVANRVSYSFDWHGPSMALDTACSSSLTAIHIACQSIRNGESSIAVAGGVNLILHPKQYSKLCRLRMLSHGSNCKSFGQGADGFVDGEGIAAIVLKPLNKAIEDHDRIYGIIKASSINAGGHSNGYTAPNPLAQSSLISSTLAKSVINPDQISYVEAHGTGTELGDPIEIRALNLAFNTKTKKQCAIGSVKSNIGHLESAAGIAGTIKVLCQIYNKKIIPTLNSNIANPHINFEESPFYLPHRALDWLTSEGKNRIAMISSFGAGGANANAIIEEFQNQHNLNQVQNKIFIIPISGNTIGALQRNIDNLRIWLKNKYQTDIPTLYSIAYTMSVCREHYKYRRFFIIENKEDLIQKLSSNIFEDSKSFDQVTHEHIDFESIDPINTDALDFYSLKALYQNIGLMYLNSQRINWTKIYTKRIVSDLPEYEFDDYKHWIEQPKYGLSEDQKYYHHHIIDGKKLLPAAYTISYVLEKTQAHNLSDISWERPLIKNIEHYKLAINHNTFLICDSEERVYVSGKISSGNGTDLNLHFQNIITQLKNCEIIERDYIYSKFNEYGYQYGPKYKNLQWIKYNSKCALGAIYCNQSGQFTIDPEIIDSGLQVPILPLANSIQLSKEKMFVPFYLGKFIIHSNEFENLIFCCWELQEDFVDKNIMKYNLYFFNQDQKPLITIYDMTSKLFNKKAESELIKPEFSKESDNIKVYDFN